MTRKQMKSEHREYGRAVLQRFAQQRALPSELPPLVRAFRAQQRRLEQAASNVESARVSRDIALKRVASADAALDRQVDVLANQLIGAELGKRANPFATFGEIPPGRLKELAYAVEVERVRKLVDAVRSKAPPRSVARALESCLAAANRSSKALAASVGPQAVYEVLISARDATLPAWGRALDRLRYAAKAAWVDDRGRYRAIFAPPGISSPRARRRRSHLPSPGGQPATAVAPAA